MGDYFIGVGIFPDCFIKVIDLNDISAYHIFSQEAGRIMILCAMQNESVVCWYLVILKCAS